ncbi:MAG: hypothetical protein OXE92_07305 [Bacteroidetes bacterium]|nr:hypothetical protein [Bacteroidota bacterium]
MLRLHSFFIFAATIPLHLLYEEFIIMAAWVKRKRLREFNMAHGDADYLFSNDLTQEVLAKPHVFR